MPTIKRKLNPQTNCFGQIELIFKDHIDYTLEEGEFKFLLATAIQTIHGDIANEPQILKFTSIDSSNYRAIIKFKTAHQARVITSLLLFGNWNKLDCKFVISKLAITPCFLVDI